MGLPLVADVHGLKASTTWLGNGPSSPAPNGGGYRAPAAPLSAGGGLLAANMLAAHCGAGDVVGAAVRITSSAYQVTSADCSSPALAIGIIVNKSSATDCTVQTSGNCAVYSGLSPGTPYFLGQSGALVAAPLPAAVTYVQQLGTASTADTLFFAPLATAYRRPT